MTLSPLQKLVEYLSTTTLEHEHRTYHKQLTGDNLRLESLIRDALAANDHDRIGRIVHQLCYDYAYAVHQPHARNGGLIGLAAAAIALGGVRRQSLEKSQIMTQTAGCSSVSSRDCTSCSGLLLGPRCKGTLLCL